LTDYLTILFLIFIFTGLEILVRYHEEPHLKKMHGKAYENYCNEVSRFIPRI
jgi:protein-S-isoprenylcysteine O-methyltransferase Ste14